MKPKEYVHAIHFIGIVVQFVGAPPCQRKAEGSMPSSPELQTYEFLNSFLYFMRKERKEEKHNPSCEEGILICLVFVFASTIGQIRECQILH